MDIKNIIILFLLVTHTTFILGQYDFNVENSNTLRQEYCELNPKSIVEIRVQKDSTGQEYKPWKIEIQFRKNKVLQYSIYSDNYHYVEHYSWEETISEDKLIRYDSTFYIDTSNLHRYGGDLSKSINHKDTVEMTFNKNGNLVSKKINHGLGGNSYEYDNLNNLIQFNNFDIEGSVTYGSWENKYNQEGKIIESRVLKQDELTDYYRMDYAPQQEKIYRITYVRGKPTSFKKTYKNYSSNNLLITKIEEESRVGLDKKSKMVYTFDDQGNVIHQIGSQFILDDLHFETWKYEYIYDDKNNWIERTTYLKQNDEKTFRWFNKDLRIIEYK